MDPHDDFETDEFFDIQPNAGGWRGWAAKRALSPRQMPGPQQPFDPGWIGSVA